MERNFKLEWEKFINGFDATEELTHWDKDTYGEMEAYCENLLISILMHFISADGVIKTEEVDTLNQIFGFNYDFEVVKAICLDMTPVLENIIQNPTEAVAVIKAANEKIASHFTEFLVAACEAIIESDAFIAPQETKLLNEFVSKIRFEK